MIDEEYIHLEEYLQVERNLEQFERLNIWDIYSFDEVREVFLCSECLYQFSRPEEKCKKPVCKDMFYFWLTQPRIYTDAGVWEMLEKWDSMPSILKNI